MRTRTWPNLANPKNRLVLALYRVAAFLLTGCPISLSLCATNVGLCDEKKSVPNIVLILADDLGSGDVQALNPKLGKIQTPNLDRFAKQGIIFTDAHSGAAVCTPTRYGLLTGRYCWRTKLQTGVLDGGDDPPLIAADRLTLPGFLRTAGYHTACLGKWHLGFTSKPPSEPDSTKKKNSPLPVGSTIVGGPTTRGFDYYWGCSNARTIEAVIENDRVVEHVEPIAMLPRLTTQAVRYLEQRAERPAQPFFLYLPLTSPHTPIVPSADWQGKSGLGAYGDFVMQTDDTVGQVLAALDRLKLAENTLVLFSSDNGFSPSGGTAKLEKQGHFPSGIYSGYKSDVWEGGHRVPFIARWPGKIKAGSTSSQLTCLGDLLATTAAILGKSLPATAGEDSVNILPALLGEPIPDELAGRVVVHHSIYGKFAIRQGAWKLCLCRGSGGWSRGGKDAAEQLYQLEKDPGEETNRIADNPAEAERLRKLLQDIVEQGRSTPGDKQRNDGEVKWRE